MTLLFCLLPTLTCAFWGMALLMAYSEQRRREKIYLSIFMLTAFVLYVGHTIFFTHTTQLLPSSDTLYCMANLAVFPLFYNYVCQITEQRPRFRLMSLLPALLGGIVVGVLYLTMTKEETNVFFNYYLYNTEWHNLYGTTCIQGIVHEILRGLFLVILILVVFFSWKKIKTYNQHVKAFFADTDDKLFEIPKSFVILFLFSFAASLCCDILGRMYFSQSVVLLAIPSITFSIILFLIGYKGFTQRFSSIDFILELKKAKRQKSQDLLTDSSEIKSVGETAQQQNDVESESGNPIRTDFTELGKRIQQLLHEERIYLNHNLTVNDLVALLGTNREYIYKAIKEEIGQSFSEMVNRQRVEHAAQILRKQPEINMFLLADEAGFASITSFYRNFKLYKGCTPKQWLKKI